MLKKLRLRFVAISMSIIIAVLVLFYLVSGALFLSTMIIDMRSVLQSYSEGNVRYSFPEIGTADENDSKWNLYSGSICVVEVKEFGDVAVLDFSRANMDEAILSRAVRFAMSAESDFGNISDLNLFYNRVYSDFGCRIAFADSAQFYYYLRTILFDGGMVLVLASVVLWIIMRFLATMCLKPVEKAWEQQKNFIADASHELKTPLTVILTNSGILKTHRDDLVENQLQWINSTYEEATHMKDLVEKLLLLAKTDNMSRKNLFTDVDLSELAMRLALQYEPVAFERGITLNTDIDAGIHITGDSLALNQIIHILLDNAVKYSGENGHINFVLKKRHSYYSLNKKTGFVYLTMQNTGAPIPQEDIPHLFERFYRSDKARTSGNGYGLGLSICKNLAFLHNADISVASSIENGTVFTVKFKVKGKMRK